MFRWRTAGLVAVSCAGAFLTVMALVVPAMPRSLQITGYSGHLAEWSLVASLAKDETGGGFSGTLTMEHNGLCSLDGPERKSGEMRLRAARFSSTIDARVFIDGVECTYRGILSDVYTGMIVCPGRRPVPLTLWMN